MAPRQGFSVSNWLRLAKPIRDVPDGVA